MMLFKKSPDSYIPQYGGFCAWGIASEYRPYFVWGKNCLGPSISLDSTLVYDNKLYLFLHKEPKRLFMKDLKNNIKRADNRMNGWFPNKSKHTMNTYCIFPSYKDIIIKV
jgi:hypothetical protein